MTVQRATQLLELGRWAEAAAAYDTVLAAEPENTDARLGRGRALAALGEHEASAEEFGHVLHRRPDHTAARYERAVVRMALGQDDRARDDLDRLLADGFDEWYVWSDRGALALRDGQVDAALVDLREAQRRAPAEPGVQVNLAVALLTTGQLDEAFALASAAADAGLPAAERLREAARHRLATRSGSDEHGPPSGPRRRPDPVRAVRPADAARYAELSARLARLHERGDRHAAAALAAQLVGVAEEVYGAGSAEHGVQVLNHAATAAADGDELTAHLALRTGVDILGDADPALLPGGLAGVATALAGAGDTETARTLHGLAAQILEQVPDQIDAVTAARVLRGHGRALIDAGRPDEAERVLAAAADRVPLVADDAAASRARVLETLADAVFAQGRPDDAIDVQQRVLELVRSVHGDLHRDTALALRGLGRLCEWAGRLPDALTWLSRSMATFEQLGGRGADPHELVLTGSDLARVYAKAGATSDAAAAARKALTLLDASPEGTNEHAGYVVDQLRETFRRLGDVEGELDAQTRRIAEIRRRSGEPEPVELNALADIHYRLGHDDEAARWYRAALDAVLRSTPDAHEVVAILRHNLANVLMRKGEVDAALDLHLRALDGVRRVYDDADARRVGALLEVAEHLADHGRADDATGLLTEARPLLAPHPTLVGRALSLARLLGEEDGTDVAAPYRLLVEQAFAALRDDAVDRGIALFEQALPLALDVAGSQHPDVALIRHNLAVARVHAGLVSGTAELLEDALAVREATLGVGDGRTVGTRIELAEVLRAQGRDAEAAEVAAPVLDIEGRTPDRSTGRAHTVVGLAAHHRRDLRAAEVHLRAAVHVADADGDTENGITARRNLVLLLLDLGGTEEAAALAAEMDTLARSGPDADADRSVRVLATRARVERCRGRLAGAEGLLRAAVDRLDRSDAADSAFTRVDTYTELGAVLVAQNRPTEAEEWLRRALAADPDPRRRPSHLLNQARVLADLGHLARAEALAAEAVALLADRTGEADSQYGLALAELGAVEAGRGRTVDGVRDLTEAHRILEAAGGPDDPRLLRPLAELAQLYLTIGARDTALSFARSALTTALHVYGEDNPVVASHLVVRARAEAFAGNTDVALHLSERAIALTPTSTAHLRWSGWLQAALGDRAAALATFRHVIALQDRRLGDVLAVASEAQRTAFLATLWESVDEFLTVALDDRARVVDPVTAREAWELVVRRRGVNAEQLRRERDAVDGPSRSSVTARLKELAGVRADLARLAHRPDEAEIRRLTARREELEHLLAVRVGASPTTPSVPVVPAGTTYVEFVRTAVVDFANRALGTPLDRADDDPLGGRPRERYLAVVAAPGTGPDAVRVHDLGPTDAIDREIDGLRAHLLPSGAPERAARRDQHGAAVRRALLDPLGVAGADRLLVVPDGPIGQVPLQILPTDDGRRIVDTHAVGYLASARDLGRPAPSGRGAVSSPLVVADPDYDLGLTGPVTAVAAVEPLPATRAEASAVGALLAVEPCTGAAAVKAALEDCRSPRLVHVATHGLFLADPTPAPPGDHYAAVHAVEVPGEGVFVVRVDPEAAEPRAVPGLPGVDADPLLRSALALAGFNGWLAGADLPPEAGNGLLTADEVCALDLRGTRVVVLSACDTGLGSAAPAEGVVGLRWAFGVAGARSVVTSLWSVADRATKELMVGFHRRLLDGEPVPDALRGAQLEIRRRRPDPFYWGAFVAHGDPGAALF